MSKYTKKILSVTPAHVSRNPSNLFRKFEVVGEVLYCHVDSEGSQVTVPVECTVVFDKYFGVRSASLACDNINNYCSDDHRALVTECLEGTHK